MKRRTFVWLSIATTASLSMPFFSCSNRDATLQKTLAHPQLLSRICDEKTLQEIGKTYRQLTPAEDDERRLQDLLWPQYAKSTTADALQATLEQNIKKDFEKQQVVVVNGWILSATEARQCALFSML